MTSNNEIMRKNFKSQKCRNKEKYNFSILFDFFENCTNKTYCFYVPSMDEVKVRRTMGHQGEETINTAELC